MLDDFLEVIGINWISDGRRIITATIIVCHSVFVKKQFINNVCAHAFNSESLVTAHIRVLVGISLGSVDDIFAAHVGRHVTSFSVERRVRITSEVVSTEHSFTVDLVLRLDRSPPHATMGSDLSGVEISSLDECV